jgi:hypothetical protein
MPTPEEAIAHADSLYDAARNALKDHMTATGEMHPELAANASKAAIAAGQVRTAVAHLGRTDEDHARTRAMIADFYDRLPRTYVTGSNAKGRVSTQTLSPDQFKAYEAGGDWPL